MGASTTPLTRALIAELRYTWYARTPLALLLAVAGGVAISWSGAFSGARAADASLRRMIAEDGLSAREIAAALAAPMTVTGEGGVISVDNALKYEFLQASDRIWSVSSPGAFASTTLGLMTFIVLPLTFAAVGVLTATRDLRQRTMQMRMVRGGWSATTLAKVVTGALLAAATIAVTLAAAAGTSAVGRSSVAALERGIGYATAPPAATPLLAQAMVAALVTFGFFLLGYASGAAARSAPLPLVVLTLVLLVIPNAGVWDPRNLLGVVGAEVFTFRGGFQPSTVPGPSPAAAVLILSAAVAGACAVIATFPRPDHRAGFARR